jgi:hypothetical protein
VNPDPTSLDRLHDIIVPSPVPWWPPTIGWYVVGAFLLYILGVLAIRACVRWRASCYRREALYELDRIVSVLRQPEQRAEAIAAMAGLLKRAAVTAFPRDRVASLSGRAWLAFLDQTGQTKAFTTGAGPWLEKVAYDPRCAKSVPAEAIEQLEIIVRHWLSRHRVDLALEGGA